MDNIRLEDVKKDLVKLANHLDGIKKTKEADFVDKILNKLGQEIPAKPVMDGDLLPNLSWPIVLEALKGILANAGVDETMIKNLVSCLPDPMIIDEIPKNLLTEFMKCAKQTGLDDVVLGKVKGAVEALFESVGNKFGESGPMKLPPSLEEGLKEGAKAAGEAAGTTIDRLKDLIP